MCRSLALAFTTLVVLAAGCMKQELRGPCYNAMQYRQQAENAQGVERAGLLGKADAAQRQCDQFGADVQEHQKREAQRKH